MARLILLLLLSWMATARAAGPVVVLEVDGISGPASADDLERSLKSAKASQLAHYLIDVTKAFGAFYRECRVLGEEPELTRARLMLVEATRRVLAQGLGLLLIPLPERM